MPLRFSVTQPPQFEIRPEINVPGNIDMAGSVFAEYPYLDSNTKGILQLVEDDDYENIERFDEEPNRNLLDMFKDYIQGGGMIGMATRGITSLGNMLRDSFRGSRFYNPRGITGNRIFAPGSRAGDPFGLNMRRDANRISRMLQRGAAGKNFSQKNLDNLLGKFGITGVDTGGMMESIAESAQTGYGGYGSSDEAAAAAASGGRDYSSSPGAMAGDMEYDEE
jgi:hypothetical protein